MNALAYYHFVANPFLSILIWILIVVVAAVAIFYILGWMELATEANRLARLIIGIIAIVFILFLIFGATGCANLPQSTVTNLTKPPTPDEARALTSLGVGDFLIIGVSDKDRPAVAAQLNSAADIFLQSASGELPAPEDLGKLLSARLPPSKTKDLVILNFVGIYRLRYGTLSTLPLQFPQSAYVKAIGAGVKDAALINLAP